MSAYPYMPLFAGDYLADTDHLSTEEHGAYLLLLMAMWRRGGSVPDDDKDLSRMTRLSLAKWQAVKKRLMPLLIFHEGEITQKRLQKEIKYAREFSEAQRQKAQKRWADVKSKTNGLADADASSGHMPDHVPELFPYTYTHPNKKLSPTKTTNSNIGKPTAKDELKKVLDKEHAQAVLEHRQALKKPLKPHGAKLLAAEFGKCPDPNAAADLMIARGWQGFEAEWMQRQAQGPPQPQPGKEAWRKRLHELEAGSGDKDREVH